MAGLTYRIINTKNLCDHKVTAIPNQKYNTIQYFAKKIPIEITKEIQKQIIVIFAFHLLTYSAKTITSKKYLSSKLPYEKKVCSRSLGQLQSPYNTERSE